MRRALFALLILAIFAIGMAAGFAANPINNTTDLSSAIDQAHKDNKSIMLIFDQNGCYYCDLFKKDVLSNNQVISQLNERFITVIIDINANADIANKYKIFGTPTTVFLDSNQKEIGRIDGYVDANEFLNIIKGI